MKESILGLNNSDEKATKEEEVDEEELVSFDDVKDACRTLMHFRVLRLVESNICDHF